MTDKATYKYEALIIAAIEIRYSLPKYLNCPVAWPMGIPPEIAPPSACGLKSRGNSASDYRTERAAVHVCLIQSTRRMCAGRRVVNHGMGARRSHLPVNAVRE